ncbi:hypothetical protein [Enterococcus faecium]|nr:hypothetical protein [Enterococcus faecium]
MARRKNMIDEKKCLKNLLEDMDDIEENYLNGLGKQIYFRYLSYLKMK